MDIKMMHEMIEKLTECAKSEMDKKGIEEVDTEEFGKATYIIKDLAEAMYYRTITEAMKESEYGEDWEEMERLRDMDRNIGRMSYSGGGSGSSSGNTGGQMSSRMQRDSESRYDKARRGYMESKEMGKEKSEKMRELENYTKELAEDVTEMVSGMSAEEKALLRSKMQNLMTKIQ